MDASELFNGASVVMMGSLQCGDSTPPAEASPSSILTDRPRSQFALASQRSELPSSDHRMSTQTASSANSSPRVEAQLLAAMRRYWGYDAFLPLQARAMQSAMTDRDSVVVLPTGGGKSLCFQAPAVCREGLALVV